MTNLISGWTPHRIQEHLKWVYEQKRLSRIKYAAKPENKKKKDSYMKEYLQRPEVIVKRKEYAKINYEKNSNYYRKGQQKKYYYSKFKVERDPWYTNKLKENDQLHARNTERLNHTVSQLPQKKTI